MDRVCHFEIPFSDKSRATAFYEKVFGWQFMEVSGDAPYTFAVTTPADEQGTPATPGGINGGLFPREDGGSARSPVLVIEVPSCEQRVREVEAAGGTILVNPTEIPNLGIYAQFRDPEGSVLGLWQPLA